MPHDGAVYTTSNGAPVNEPYASQRAGINGPLLLQGMYWLSSMAYLGAQWIIRLPPHRSSRSL